MSIDYKNAVKKYLNQNIEHKKNLGYDEYGKAIFADAERIAVRKVPHQKLVVDKSGRQVETKTTVLTNSDVSVGDLIDNEVVIGVEWGVDRFGRRVCLQVYL